MAFPNGYSGMQSGSRRGPITATRGRHSGGGVGGGWFVKRMAVCVSRELDFHLLCFLLIWVCPCCQFNYTNQSGLVWNKLQVISSVCDVSFNSMAPYCKEVTF